MNGNGLQVIYEPLEISSGKWKDHNLIEEYNVFNINIKNILNGNKSIDTSDFTYCKKKNGEIYIPENEIVSRSYCLSDEYVTTENAYKNIEIN